MYGSYRDYKRLYWSYIGIMENQMETTIYGLGCTGFRVHRTGSLLHYAPKPGTRGPEC